MLRGKQNRKVGILFMNYESTRNDFFSLHSRQSENKQETIMQAILRWAFRYSCQRKTYMISFLMHWDSNPSVVSSHVDSASSPQIPFPSVDVI